MHEYNVSHLLAKLNKSCMDSLNTVLVAIFLREGKGPEKKVNKA